MLIKEAIVRCRKDIGVTSDDTFITRRYVYRWLKDVRNELLRQEVEKKGLANLPMQTLYKFEFEAIDSAETDQFESGTIVFKSKHKFPTMLDTINGKTVGSVYLPTGERIDVVTDAYATNAPSRRFTTNKPMFVFKNGYAYLRRYPAITETLYLDIEGIFESPEQVALYNTEECDRDCIFYPDLEFSIPGYLTGRLFRMVRQELLRTLGIPEDVTNNGKNDVGDGAGVPQPQQQQPQQQQ